MVKTERTLSHGEHSHTFRENAPLKNVFLLLENHTDRLNHLEEKIHNWKPLLLPSLYCYSSFSFLFSSAFSPTTFTLHTPVCAQNVTSPFPCLVPSQTSVPFLHNNRVWNFKRRRKDFWTVKTWYLSIYVVMSTYFLHKKENPLDLFILTLLLSKLNIPVFPDFLLLQMISKVSRF